MKNRRLYKVDLLKQDTCLTYAIRRLNIMSFLSMTEHQLFTLDITKALDEYFSTEEFSHDKIHVGCLLLWNKPKSIYINNSIEEHGSCKQRECIVGIHVGVVEHISEYNGNFLFSDVTRMNNKWGLPEIRVRQISELEQMPAYILIPKNIKY